MTEFQTVLLEKAETALVKYYISRFGVMDFAQVMSFWACDSPLTQLNMLTGSSS